LSEARKEQSVQSYAKPDAGVHGAPPLGGRGPGSWGLSPLFLRLQGSLGLRSYASDRSEDRVMTDVSDMADATRDIELPDGTLLPGTRPVVIIGPNGSGKTRRARDLIASTPLEFINAMRNTRILPSVQVMSYMDAENNFTGQRNQAKNTHWDWTNEFDYLLASLLAQHATTAIKFMDAVRSGETAEPVHDPLQRVRNLWHVVFPGRLLTIDDYSLAIDSSIYTEPVKYKAQTMSDGERAAIYLAGRVFARSLGFLSWTNPKLIFTLCSLHDCGMSLSDLAQTYGSCTSRMT
jgi:hypothetical protein